MNSSWKLLCAHTIRSLHPFYSYGLLAYRDFTISALISLLKLFSGLDCLKDKQRNPFGLEANWLTQTSFPFLPRIPTLPLSSWTRKSLFTWYKVQVYFLSQPCPMAHGEKIPLPSLSHPILPSVLNLSVPELPGQNGKPNGAGPQESYSCLWKEAHLQAKACSAMQSGLLAPSPTCPWPGWGKQQSRASCTKPGVQAAPVSCGELLSGVLGQFQNKASSKKSTPTHTLRSSSQIVETVLRTCPLLPPAGFLAVTNPHGTELCLAYVFGILRSSPLEFGQNGGRNIIWQARGTTQPPVMEKDNNKNSERGASKEGGGRQQAGKDQTGLEPFRGRWERKKSMEGYWSPLGLNSQGGRQDPRTVSATSPTPGFLLLLKEGAGRKPRCPAPSQQPHSSQHSGPRVERSSSSTRDSGCRWSDCSRGRLVCSSCIVSFSVH